MMMRVLKSISVILAFFRLPHSYRVKEKNVILKSIAAATLLSILMVICEVIWLQGLERQTNNMRIQLYDSSIENSQATK